MGDVLSLISSHCRTDEFCWLLVALSTAAEQPTEDCTGADFITISLDEELFNLFVFFKDNLGQGCFFVGHPRTTRESVGSTVTFLLSCALSR